MTSTSTHTRSNATPPTPPKLADRLRSRWKVLTAIGVALLAVGAWLAFGFFGIQSAFIDDKVDEAGPVFDSGAAVTETEPGTNTDPTNSDDAADPVVDDGASDALNDDATEQESTEAQTDDAAATGSGEGAIETVAAGDFAGRSRYDVAGTATVLTDGSEQRFVRFEDFESSNGPDLKVYLATDGDVSGDFVSLGDLKGNIGSQNYEIPADVDLGQLNTVVIWCERFSTGFGSAPLA